MTRKKKVLIGCGSLFVALAATLVGIMTWARYGAPASAPRIGLSVSDVWYDAVRVNPAPYAAAIARCGGSVRLLSPGDDPDRALDGLDGIVLAGSHEDVDPALFGGDLSRVWGVNRARDDFEIELLKRAEARGLPVLAVCRGAQLLAVAHGGRLARLEGEQASRHGITAHSFKAHAIRIEPGSRLEAPPGAVSSTHFQAIVDPGPRLRVAARAEDGVIEAVELPGPRLCVGIQWHPELDALRGSAALAPFRLLVTAAGASRPAPVR